MSLRQDDAQLQQQPEERLSIQPGVSKLWWRESSGQDATAKQEPLAVRTQGQEDDTTTVNGPQRRKSALTQCEPNGANHA